MKKIIFQTVFACGVLFSLVNCSKDSGGGNSGAPGVGVNTVCTAGSVYTSQGCLPSQQCAYMGPNYGWNGTQCIGGDTGSINGACGAGMVYSAQYGCLAQCGVNSGWMNNQCINVGQQAQNCNGYNNYSNNGYNNYNNGYNNSYNNCGNTYNNGYNNNGYYDRYYQQQRPRAGAWYGFGVW